jgi:hypothetical protein
LQSAQAMEGVAAGAALRAILSHGVEMAVVTTDGDVSMPLVVRDALKSQKVTVLKMDDQNHYFKNIFTITKDVATSAAVRKEHMADLDDPASSK